MSAGKNYARAKAQAQANADHAQSPRWLHQYRGVWWISGTPTTDSEQIDPHKKSHAQIKREIDKILARKPAPRGHDADVSVTDIVPGDSVQHTGSLRRGRVVEIGKTHRDGTIEYRMKVDGDDPSFEVWWNSARVRRIEP